MLCASVCNRVAQSPFWYPRSPGCHEKVLQLQMQAWKCKARDLRIQEQKIEQGEAFCSIVLHLDGALSDRKSNINYAK